MLQLSDNRIVELSPKIALLQSVAAAPCICADVQQLQWLSIENNPVNTLPIDVVECKSIDLLQMTQFGLQPDIRDLLQEGAQVQAVR